MLDEKPADDGKKTKVSFVSVAIWVGVGGIALYLIGSGVIGLIAKGS